MRQPHLHPERGAQQGQRVVDVVAVADEREHEALQPSEPLLHGEHVGERLAGMLAQGQAVDDRDVGLGGELQGDLVRTCPDHDRVDDPLEVAGHVTDALAGAEHGVVGQVDGVAAELGHPGLEGDPCPQARLLEEHRQRAPGQRQDARAGGSPGTPP